jgi:hypothetical protein
MPEVKGPIELAGAFVAIRIMQSPELIQALTDAGLSPSAPTTILALLDTGASISALDPNLTRQLGLQERGFTQIHTPSTGPAVAPCREFDAMVVLGMGEGEPLTLTISVIEAEFASQGFLGLIGRDILNAGVLTYDGPAGVFTFSW